MKTMQLKDKVVRVNEDRATTLFSEGWQYVAKSVWKEKVRDVNKKEETKKSKKKKSKKKK